MTGLGPFPTSLQYSYSVSPAHASEVHRLMLFQFSPHPVFFFWDGHEASGTGYHDLSSSHSLLQILAIGDYARQIRE